ncbi:hypothetical protein I4U23_022882 [Adineta vaga]|nr:hypothetical protein I4U23_022882 [Adineta vaga]
MISTFSSNTDAKEENISHLLYYLCKENEIEKVQNILLSIDNKNIINRIQTSTGSTCLHVACYYGHRDMVQILLDYGALRSTRNLRHNLTPYEEIHADDIKQLFVKQQELFSNNSYDYIEWSLVDDDLLGKRRRFRQVINLYKTYDNHNLISKLIAEFIHYYLNEYLLNLSNSTGNPEDRVTPEQIKTLEAYFKGAIEEKDYLTYFIKAYTLTNGFHKILNKHLALYILDYFDESKIFLPTYRLVNCLAHIVTLIIYHPNLSQYEYRGVCYRGMRVTQYDLNQYKVNQHMLNRSFLSTSSDRHVAAMFAGEGQQSKMRYTPKGDWALQYSCLCQYSIKQNATAIDINTLSTKPEEKEVLILPFTVFKVIDIKRNDLYNPTAPISIEIELEECEDPNDDFKQLKNMKETKQSRLKPNGLTTTPLGQYNSTVNPILSTGKHFSIISARLGCGGDTSTHPPTHTLYSLKCLQLDYVDLYYVHRIDSKVLTEEAMNVLKEIVQRGKIKYIGLSEYSSYTIRRAYKVHSIAAVRIEYSPFSLDIEREDIGALKTCRELGIAIVCYSPLGREMLTGQIRSFEDFEANNIRRKFSRFSKENFPKNLQLIENLKEIASKKNCTTGQLTLAWVLAQGEDFIAIPGKTKIKNLEENVDAANIKLTKENITQIRQACENANICWEIIIQNNLLMLYMVIQLF